MSGRERQVLDRTILGGTNKSIARDLGVSSRTVESHRAHVRQRLGAKTLPGLVLLAAAAGIAVATLDRRSRQTSAVLRRRAKRPPAA